MPHAGAGVQQHGARNRTDELLEYVVGSTGTSPMMTSTEATHLATYESICHRPRGVSLASDLNASG